MNGEIGNINDYDQRDEKKRREVLPGPLGKLQLAARRRATAVLIRVLSFEKKPDWWKKKKNDDWMRIVECPRFRDTQEPKRATNPYDAAELRFPAARRARWCEVVELAMKHGS